jgi:glycosyltransferase involved in cell wall biosynthesis
MRSIVLRSEQEIMSRWDEKYEVPLVSIMCLAYNHEKYIEDALKGFLIQETDFPFEVLIHDDASTDRTADIIREYEKKYPNIVKPIYQKENQWSRDKNKIRDAQNNRIKGKYLAYCEGDDYWIDPCKLQLQTYLMLKYPNVVMCVAGAAMCKLSDDKFEFIGYTSNPGVELCDVDIVHKMYFHTSTYVIRRDVLMEISEKYFAGESLYGDTALRAILVSYGSFVFLSRNVSVYRITGHGVWTSIEEEEKINWEFNVAFKLSKVLKGKHMVIQKKILSGFAKSLIKINIKKKKYCKAMRYIKYVDWAEMIIRYYMRMLNIY